MSPARKLLNQEGAETDGKRGAGIQRQGGVFGYQNYALHCRRRNMQNYFMHGDRGYLLLIQIHLVTLRAVHQTLICSEFF
jgi:hypothetical protein